MLNTTKINTYRAMPHTRRSAVIDFFRQRIFRLPTAPMPYFSFEHDANGVDFELFTKIPAPSPIRSKAEAYELAKKWCDAQNAAWHTLIAGWKAKETVLDLFPNYLVPADCYPVYHPQKLDWILYWQVNYRVELPSVRIGQQQHRAAVQGEYVRVGVYHAHAVVTVNYHHFAVEALDKEPYFFAPKQAAENAPAIDTTNALAKGAKPSSDSHDETSKAGEDFDHEALFFKRVGDAYAGFAATPEGAVAASKGGVAWEKEQGYFYEDGKELVNPQNALWFSYKYTLLGKDNNSQKLSYNHSVVIDTHKSRINRKALPTKVVGQTLEEINEEIIVERYTIMYSNKFIKKTKFVGEYGYNMEVQSIVKTSYKVIKKNNATISVKFIAKNKTLTTEELDRLALERKIENIIKVGHNYLLAWQEKNPEISTPFLGGEEPDTPNTTLLDVGKDGIAFLPVTGEYLDLVQFLQTGSRFYTQWLSNDEAKNHYQESMYLNKNCLVELSYPKWIGQESIWLNPAGVYCDSFKNQIFGLYKDIASYHTMIVTHKRDWHRLDPGQRELTNTVK
jgi:hypothetical protein